MLCSLFWKREVYTIYFLFDATDGDRGSEPMAYLLKVAEVLLIIINDGLLL